MSGPAHGQVHKVIRVVGTSSTSWEAAARNAVDEAARTISELRAATVTRRDVALGRDGTLLYRLELETTFQLDRSRQTASGASYQVRRYLIIANQTLCSERLRAEIAQREAAGPAEFHILVPQAPRPTGQMTNALDMGPVAVATDEDRAVARQEATERLRMLGAELADLATQPTGEVSLTDPLEAARRTFEYGSFDEILLSTLPAGFSRWLRLDLPSRLERAFDVPVVAVVHDADSASVD